MYLLVKNLNPYDGIELIERALFTKNVFFYKNNLTVRAVIILGIEDKSGNIVENHGLIRIEYAHHKLQVMNSLKSRLAVATGLSVSEFHVRHWSNDRRQQGRKSYITDRDECRRFSDRRRRELSIIKIYEKTYN